MGEEGSKLPASLRPRDHASRPPTKCKIRAERKIQMLNKIVKRDNFVTEQGVPDA